MKKERKQMKEWKWGKIEMDMKKVRKKEKKSKNEIK